MNQLTFWLKEKVAKSPRPPNSPPPLPKYSHVIYTDLRGHQFWIKIGKKIIYCIFFWRLSLSKLKLTLTEHIQFGITQIILTPYDIISTSRR